MAELEQCWYILWDGVSQKDNANYRPFYIWSIWEITRGEAVRRSGERVFAGPQENFGGDIQTMKLNEFSPGQEKKKGSASRCPKHKGSSVSFAHGTGQKHKGLEGREPGVFLQVLVMVIARIAGELEQV